MSENFALSGGQIYFFENHVSESYLELKSLKHLKKLLT